MAPIEKVVYPLVPPWKLDPSYATVKDTSTKVMARIGTHSLMTLQAEHKLDLLDPVAMTPQYINRRHNEKTITRRLYNSTD